MGYEVTIGDDSYDLGELKTLVDQETKINWEIGDLLVSLQSMSDDPKVSPVRRLCEAGALPMSEGKANLRIRVSSVFGDKERAYGLPWAYYAYATIRTVDPVNWVHLAYSNKWSLRDFAREVKTYELNEKQKCQTKLDEYAPILSINIKGKAKVSAYYHFQDTTAEPFVKVSLVDENFSVEESSALANAIERCIEVILDAIDEPKAA